MLNWNRTFWCELEIVELFFDMKPCEGYEQFFDKTSKDIKNIISSLLSAVAFAKKDKSSVFLVLADQEKPLY